MGFVNLMVEVSLQQSMIIIAWNMRLLWRDGTMVPGNEIGNGEHNWLARATAASIGRHAS